MGPPLFLVFINDPPEHLICNPKLFADDVSLNAIMYDEKYSTENIEHDLKLIHDWSVNNEFFLVYYYDKLSYLYYYIVILHLLLWVNRVAIKEDLVEAEKQRNMESVVI